MNEEEIEFFETRIPILRRHYVLVSEFNGQINEEETKKLFDYIRELRVKNHKLKQENQQLKKQLEDIHSEFAKYDWEGATKEQTFNQIRSLYNAIYKESDVK